MSPAPPGRSSSLAGCLFWAAGGSRTPSASPAGAPTTNPSAPRLQVVYVGPKPDLLRHEAQAIVTGKMGEDGVFYADELLLKCPTRYEEEVPLQAVEGGS